MTGGDSLMTSEEGKSANSNNFNKLLVLNPPLRTAEKSDASSFGGNINLNLLPALGTHALHAGPSMMTHRTDEGARQGDQTEFMLEDIHN
jgi:hypothetical protein